MRHRTVPALGILSISAVLALTGCQTAASEASTEPATDAPITIATLPLGDDPTQANPIEAFAELVEKETGRTVEVTDVPDYIRVPQTTRGRASRS